MTLPNEALAVAQLGNLRASSANGTLPLGLGPQKIDDIDGLTQWPADHGDWVKAALQTHGALFFRGFQPADALAFEQVARAIAPGLQSEYLGTRIGDARHIASEATTRR